MTALVSTVAAGAATLIAVGGGLLIAAATHRSHTSRVRQQLVRVTGGQVGTDETDYFGALILAFGRRGLRRSNEFEELSTLAQSAGLFSPLAPYRIFAVQLISAIGCGLIATGAFAAFTGDRTLVALGVFAGIAIGYLTPRVVLRVLASGRRRRIRHELPFFLDTMLMLLRGGLGLERCLREIAQLGADAMPETVRSVELMIADLEQGRSYDEALDRWADRMAHPAVREISQQLQQSMNHGTELSKALAAFAQRLIAQQLATARERAGRRTIHVTAVTMLFFMPPLLIVLAAPGFTQVVRLLGHN